MADYRISKRAIVASVGATLRPHPSAAAKLETRLKLLNRLGFPHGVNAGRGFRGGYTLDQLWQVVLAFRVLKFAVPLSRTIEIVNESWDIAYAAIANSLPGRRLAEHSFYWLIDPPGLSDLDLEPSPGTSGWTRPIETIALEDGQTVHDVAVLRNLADYGVINASAVVDDVLTALADPALEIDQDELRAMLVDWAMNPINQLRSLAGKRK